MYLERIRQKMELKKGPWIHTKIETKTWRSHEQTHRQIATKKYYTKFVKCILLHFQEITHQFDFKVSSPQRESLREDNQIFCKVLKVGCVQGPIARLLTLCAQRAPVMYKVFLLSSSVLHYFIHKICLEVV